VRKAEKAHGTGRRIEGFCREGARVVIVDDVCTTGASTINAIQAARDAGMVVAAVVCLVERQEAGGRPAVEAAAEAMRRFLLCLPQTMFARNTFGQLREI
jgi:orotate phosphoribosyltransferase